MDLFIKASFRLLAGKRYCNMKDKDCEEKHVNSSDYVLQLHYKLCNRSYCWQTMLMTKHIVDYPYAFSVIFKVGIPVDPWPKDSLQVRSSWLLKSCDFSQLCHQSPWIHFSSISFAQITYFHFYSLARLLCRHSKSIACYEVCWQDWDLWY